MLITRMIRAGRLGASLSRPHRFRRTAASRRVRAFTWRAVSVRLRTRTRPSSLFGRLDLDHGGLGYRGPRGHELYHEAGGADLCSYNHRSYLDQRDDRTHPGHFPIYGPSGASLLISLTVPSPRI